MKNISTPGLKMFLKTIHFESHLEKSTNVGCRSISLEIPKYLLFENLQLLIIFINKSSGCPRVGWAGITRSKNAGTRGTQTPVQASSEIPLMPRPDAITRTNTDNLRMDESNVGTCHWISKSLNGIRKRWTAWRYF